MHSQRKYILVYDIWFTMTMNQRYISSIFMSIFNSLFNLFPNEMPNFRFENRYFFLNVHSFWLMMIYGQNSDKLHKNESENAMNFMNWTEYIPFISIVNLKIHK